MESIRPMTLPSKQKGNALLMVAMAIFLTMLLAVIGGAELLKRVNDSAAESTGRYLLTVKGAVQGALSTYFDTFALVDTSADPDGAAQTPPTWAQFTGASTTIGVDQLKSSGLLRDDFPNSPPLGRSVHIRLVRENCPGDECAVRAYAYTCWPIAKARSPVNADPSSCPAVPAGLEFDMSLLGQTVISMDGYGGSNAINPTRVNGGLFNIPASDLGITSAGHAVVIASLDATMFNQYVRQGDTRHIKLRNDLSVTGKITTDEGLVMNTSVIPNAACTVPGMYATSSRSSLVMCSGGRWFELTNHVLMGAQSLANGATVVTPSCPSPGMQAFTYASLERLDVTMTGSDINVRGRMNGNIRGTGQTNMNGAVTVSGTYEGDMQSTPDSRIRVTQGVQVTGGRVVITPADPQARALVIQGCRYM